MDAHASPSKDGQGSGFSNRRRFALTAAAALLLLPLLVTGQALAIWAADPPTNLTPPEITGTAQSGQTLTCSQGTWSGSPSSYAYQWNRDGVAIAGAASATYTVGDADVGRALTCTVTASNAFGSTSATSAPVTPTASSSGGSTPGTDQPPTSGDQPPSTDGDEPGASDVFDMPSRKHCVSRRNFRIRIKDVAGLTLTRAVVKVNDKRVKVVKENRLKAPVNLTGLPKGQFTVAITAYTSTGSTITGKRKYRTCAKKTPGGKPRL